MMRKLGLHPTIFHEYVEEKTKIEIIIILTFR